MITGSMCLIDMTAAPQLEHLWRMSGRRPYRPALPRDRERTVGSFSPPVKGDPMGGATASVRVGE